MSDQLQGSWNPYPIGGDGEGGVECHPMANYVELEAEPCPGWVFDHWEGCANGEWHTAEDAQGNPITGNLELYMNWCRPTEAGEFHPPQGEEVFQVRAVFEAPYCGTIDCEGPDSREVIRSMYDNPAIVDQHGTRYLPVPDCEKFYTSQAGHRKQFVEYEEMTFSRLSCEHGTTLDPHSDWQLDDGASFLFRGVRYAYGSPIRITSVYRCPRHNDLFEHSLATSQHAKGTAFDYNVRSTAGNWAVAVAARSVGASSILLYRTSGHNPEDMLTFDQISDCEGCDPPDVLPPGWENGILHGHIDAR